MRKNAAGWRRAGSISAPGRWEYRRIFPFLAGCGKCCPRISICGSIKWMDWDEFTRRRKGLLFLHWILFLRISWAVPGPMLSCAGTGALWKRTAGFMPVISAEPRRPIGMGMVRRRFSGPCAAKRIAPATWHTAEELISGGGSFSENILSLEFPKKPGPFFWIWTGLWFRRDTGESCRTGCGGHLERWGGSVMCFWPLPCRKRKSGKG